MTQRHYIQNEKIMLITTVTHNRIPIFAEIGFANEAIETLYRVKSMYAFFLYGFVIMPDHCHFLLQVPVEGSISRIMNVYKSGVSFNTNTKRIWQKRFDSRIVKHSGPTLEYIHMNPVKAGLSESPEEYPWSSATGKWDTDECPMFC